MRTLYALFLLACLAVYVAASTGCDDKTPKGEPAADTRAELVIDHDGVKVWRVTEPTKPGSTWRRTVCYYTTPSGDVTWPTTRLEGKRTVTDTHETKGHAKP